MTETRRGRPKGCASARDVEDELELLIERRSGQNGADEERTEMWRESVRKYHRRRGAEHRRAWIEYERHMSELHGRLALEHEERARDLENAQS